MMARLWVERNKDGSWDAFSDDGAHIKFGRGSDKGLFSPGDLTKIALAGCAALSSQFAVESVLGEGKGARIVVDGTYDSDGDRYLNFNEQLVVDAMDAGLDQEAAEKLAERIRRHVDKGCTVKHTYEIETPVRMDVDIRH
ncbi:OsmC family protein [Alloscardovia omnicolens]|uniref:OsmC family protein n=1 Tax=Alloscardovia omnicolens TaxID=419015 RepID=UPI003A60517F